MVAVLGIGATALPTPPTETVYQSKFVPVADSATDDAPWQYVTGVVTVGFAGNPLMVTLIWERVLTHPVIVFV